MVNNIRNEQRVSIMARKQSLDDVWDEIFDSLVLGNEPPFEYIKNVIITTKTGLRLKVNATDFAHILERERYLTPEESDILSCKLAINFTKVRKDVDEWAHDLLNKFDGMQDPNNASKPRAKKPAAKTAAKTKKAPAKKTPVKKSPTKTTAKTAAKTTRKPKS